MKLYDLLFFSLYTLVPKKAMLGKRTVAVILISLVLATIMFSIYLFLGAFYFRVLGEKIVLGIGVTLIAIGSFYFNIKMFEDKDRLKEVIKRNEPARPFHKAIAIGLLFGAYVLFIASTYFVDRYVDSH